MGKKQWLKLQIKFSSKLQFCLERCVTNIPLKQRLRCASCFINKKSESLDLLSSFFRYLAGSANKDCVSSIAGTLRAMKGKQKKNIQLFRLQRGTKCVQPI